MRNALWYVGHGVLDPSLDVQKSHSLACFVGYRINGFWDGRRAGFCQRNAPDRRAAVRVIVWRGYDIRFLLHLVRSVSVEPCVVGCVQRQMVARTPCDQNAGGVTSERTGLRSVVVNGPGGQSQNLGGEKFGTL